MEKSKLETYLIKKVEEYYKTSQEIVSLVYDIIDGEKDKVSASTIITKQKKTLRALEDYLKIW